MASGLIPYAYIFSPETENFEEHCVEGLRQQPISPHPRQIKTDIHKDRIIHSLCQREQNISPLKIGTSSTLLKQMHFNHLLNKQTVG